MKKLALLWLLLVIISLEYVAAQTTAYQVTRSACSNGGGYCTNAEYQLNGTLSQHFIELTQDNQWQHKIGCWYWGEENLTTCNFAPPNKKPTLTSCNRWSPIHFSPQQLLDLYCQNCQP